MNQLFQKGEQKLKQYEEDGTSIHPCHANQIRKGQGWLSVGWFSDPGPPKNIQIFGRLVNTPWQKMPRCRGGGNIGINNLTNVAARLHDVAETRAEGALVQNINDFQTVSSNIMSRKVTQRPACRRKLVLGEASRVDGRTGGSDQKRQIISSLQSRCHSGEPNRVRFQRSGSSQKLGGWRPTKNAFSAS